MLRRKELWGPLVLPGIVGVSTLVHWITARQFDGFWIMPDEAIYARRALALWQDGHLPLLGGEGAGYGVLYPVLIGAPLALGDFATGYESLKLLQALVMSLAAVPVFFWGRRLMPPLWAAVPAALTVASPLLLYVGLVMTEVLFYPVAALALFAVADAVERATPRAQALALLAIAAAVLTRVQGIVLVAIFAGAVLLDAAFARDGRRLRLFWPLWAVVAAGVIVTLAAPGVFGSYSEVVQGRYPFGDALRLTLDHMGWIVVSTGVLPAAALTLLLVQAVRGREQDAGVRALVAVAVATCVLVALQIGVFASRYAPHLLERDCAAVPPVLFLAFGVWLARGAPRPRLLTGAVALTTLALLAAMPWRDLVIEEALPDTFSLSALYRLRDHDPAVVATLVAAVLLALFALVPTRLRLALPVVVGGALVWATIPAVKEIEARVHWDQTHLVGTPRNWIDVASGDHRVSYLYDGERYFNGVWQAVAWNHNINRVLSVAPTRVPGPMPQRTIEPANDGQLGVPAGYVVATTPHTFLGTPIAHIEQVGEEVAGLTLWRLAKPARLSTIESGIRTNGDMVEPGRLRVFDCAGGRLEMTLLPKATQVVTVRLDDRVVLRQRIGGLPYWNGTAYVPPSPRPRNCLFTIQGQSLLGSTRIEFVRR
jgi:hypothetical protein